MLKVANVATFSATSPKKNGIFRPNIMLKVENRTVFDSQSEKVPATVCREKVSKIASFLEPALAEYYSKRANAGNFSRVTQNIGTVWRNLSLTVPEAAFLEPVWKILRLLTERNVKNSESVHFLWRLPAGSQAGRGESGCAPAEPGKNRRQAATRRSTEPEGKETTSRTGGG